MDEGKMNRGGGENRLPTKDEFSQQLGENDLKERGALWSACYIVGKNPESNMKAGIMLSDLFPDLDNSRIYELIDQARQHLFDLRQNQE